MIQYFLPLILLFGLITSYEDICKGKIRNRYILIALLGGIAIYASYIVYTILSPDLELSKIYYIETILNSIIALTIGFILWLMSFWSPGDAKLFFAYSFLIPISIYSINRIPFFRSFYLIFNSFIPFLLFAVVLTIRDKVTCTSYREIKQGLTLKSMASNFAYTFTITWIAGYIISLLNIENNILSVIITSSLLVYIVRKYIYENIPEQIGKIKLRTIILLSTATLISLFRLYLDFENIATFNFVWQFIVYYIAIATVQTYIKSEAKSFFVREVHVLHLWEGMHIADTIIKKQENCEDKDCRKDDKNCKRDDEDCNKECINENEICKQNELKCKKEDKNCKKEIYTIADDN
ncbi:MAG: hypothetical protein ACMXX5_01390, partial [Candidatus Woesearchaeota archaeon]